MKTQEQIYKELKRLYKNGDELFEKVKSENLDIETMRKPVCEHGENTAKISALTWVLIDK